jgi:hypothetical protein
MEIRASSRVGAYSNHHVPCSCTLAYIRAALAAQVSVAFFSIEQSLIAAFFVLFHYELQGSQSIKERKCLRTISSIDHQYRSILLVRKPIMYFFCTSILCKVARSFRTMVGSFQTMVAYANPRLGALFCISSRLTVP